MSLIQSFNKGENVSSELAKEVLNLLNLINPNEKHISIFKFNSYSDFTGIAVDIMHDYIGCRRYENGKDANDHFKYLWDNLKEKELKLKKNS